MGRAIVAALVVLVAGAATIGAIYLKQYAGESLRRNIREVIEHEAWVDAGNIGLRVQRIACEQTARFVIEKMPKVPAFRDRFALLDHSLASVDPAINGLYCEFGVFTGATINHIASKTSHTIHGFDSFEGLPETWITGAPKGSFAVSALPQVRANVKLHKGWFDQSVPVWAQSNPGPIEFLHMDADLYSSTKTVFDLLGDRIRPGTVIQFDDYFNYPGWQSDGEYKAFEEFVRARRVTFEYLGYCGDGAPVQDIHQVSVRILSINDRPTAP
jgi:hypothetical protein